MAGLSDLIGGKGSGGSQIFEWTVLGALVAAIGDPVWTALRAEAWKAADSAAPGTLFIPLSPPELAEMVIKNITDQASARATAQLSGVNPNDFDLMVLNTGEPPGIEEALLMWRRGIIPEGPDTPGVASVDAAIRTSRLRDEWAPAIKASRVVPISTSAAVDAVLRNQTDLAAGEQIAYENGIAQTDFDLLVNTAGNPPSLTELLELAKRGIIPWGNLDPATRTPAPDEISFAQGIFEGDSKDKWLPYYARLGEYYPPPRTIVTLLRNGSITPAQASDYLTKAGLAPDLAQAYISSASHTKAVAQKQLSLSTVLGMYEAKSIDAPTATTFIENLGYTAAEAAAELAFADYQRAHKSLTAAVNRIGAAYVAKKIDANQATTALGQLGVPSDAITQYIQEWQVEKTTQVRLLTAGTIVSAHHYGVFSADPTTNQNIAMQKLEDLGYSPYDAWVELSARAHGPLPNQPPGP